MNEEEGTESLTAGVRKSRESEHQIGQFYCSGCGRMLRHTHAGEAICLTSGCKFKSPIRYADDYDG